MFFMRPAAIWTSEVSSGLFVIHVLDIRVVIPIELRITTGALTVFRYWKFSSYLLILK